VTVYVHDLAGVEISFLHIKWVEQDYPATAKDAAIAVIQPINCRVELIVGPDRGEKKFVRLEVMLGNGAND
jgi:hypothetical protein